jgi:hypothetical protein
MKKRTLFLGAAGISVSVSLFFAGCGVSDTGASAFREKDSGSDGFFSNDPPKNFAEAGGDPTDIDALLTAGCATAQQQAERAPIYMLFVLDGSGSMNESGKWQAVIPALRAIFDEFRRGKDPSIGVGLTIFADQNDPTIGEYTAGPYDKMDVPLAVVDDGQFGRLTQRMDSTSPYLGTPTYEVLFGQYALLRQFQPTAPLVADGHKALVLITDGVPDEDMPAGADQVPGSLRLAAEALGTAAPQGPILTYVLGVGPFPMTPDAGVAYSPSFCGALSVAGGTRSSDSCNPNENSDPNKTCYFQVTPPPQGAPSQAEIDALKGKFIDALSAIRTKLLSCEYSLTSKVDEQHEVVDPNNVNVIYTEGGSGKRTIVPNDGVNGWSYDNPTNPTKVILHGQACNNAKADVAGKITVVLGCRTITR